MQCAFGNSRHQKDRLMLASCHGRVSQRMDIGVPTAMRSNTAMGSVTVQLTH